VHEAFLAQSLVDQVTEELERQGISGKVQFVEVAVGVFSGVHPEALEFAFSVLRANTPLEEAKLVIRRIPAECRCDACGHREEVNEPVGACPSCGSSEIHFHGGRELRVDAIEVEEPLSREETAPHPEC